MGRYLLVFLTGLVIGALGIYYLLKKEPRQEPSTAQTAPAIPPPVAPAPSPEPTVIAQPPPSPAALPSMVPPIEGLKAADLHDDFNETHSGHKHEAMDILEPRGTPVHAVVDGTIQKLFLSKPGGITIYQFDEPGLLCYYYAHLDRYAENLHEGLHVTRGDVIGYVGSTGNADPATPHLHFAILRLGPDKHWWQNTEPLNPYPFLLNLVQRSN